VVDRGAIRAARATTPLIGQFDPATAIMDEVILRPSVLPTKPTLFSDLALASAGVQFPRNTLPEDARFEVVEHVDERGTLPVARIGRAGPRRQRVADRGCDPHAAPELRTDDWGSTRWYGPTTAWARHRA
jgi:hypothetical protein